MEMARLATRLIEGKSIGTLPLLVVLAVLLGASMGAGGCGKPICPTGMRPDSRRSKPGQTTFCESTVDKKLAAFVDLYPDGARRQICPFVDGRPAGSYQAFHPTGARRLEGRYENGLKVGRWTQWTADGRKVADGEYRAGQMIEGAPVGFPATCERIIW